MPTRTRVSTTLRSRLLGGLIIALAGGALALATGPDSGVNQLSFFGSDAWAGPTDPAAAPPAAVPAAAPADPATGAAPDPNAPPAEAGATDTGSAGDEAAAEEEAAPEAEPEPEESPWKGGLILSVFALSLGGLSAVLGIWVDRDKRRPAIFAGVMSVLIGSACLVGAAQGYLDSLGAIQQKADLKRMIGMVNEIAKNSGDPSLTKLLEEEGAVPKGSTEIAEKAAADKAAAEKAAEEAAAAAEGAPVDGAPVEGAPPADGTAPAPVEGATPPAAPATK